MIDSATAGKGLDEIIHLFESPLPNKASLIEVSSTAAAFDENLDEYESPADEVTDMDEGNFEHETGDISDGEDKGLDLPDDSNTQLDDDQDQASTDSKALDDEEQREEGTTEADGHIIDGATLPENVDANGNTTTPTPFTLPQCFRPHFCLCPNCAVEYAEEHDQKETRFRKALEFQQALGENEMQQKGPHNPRRGFFHQIYAHSDFSTTFSYQDADDLTQELPESESNPFINLELEDGAELADEIDLVNDDDAAEDSITFESNLVNANRANTSTTTTLRDEDDAVSPDVNLDTTLAAEEPLPENDAEDEDELAEIDWREEAEVSVEGSGSPSGIGKRARADDDEFDAEEEKGMFTVASSCCPRSH